VIRLQQINVGVVDLERRAAMIDHSDILQ